MIMEILSQDLGLANEPAQLHFFHKWTKWYRVKINYLNHQTFLFETIEQQRHCIICNKRQKMSIEEISCQ